MTQNSNLVKIGGVTYDNREIAKKESVRKADTNDSGLWEEYNEYKVTLKDGTKLVYNEQNEDRKATVDVFDTGMVAFYGLLGAEIQGTDKRDSYFLSGCEETTVDVTGDPGPQGFMAKFKPEHYDTVTQENRVLPDGSAVQFGKNNSIFTDATDYHLNWCEYKK